MSCKVSLRYLTPRECFRLMGQDDDSIDRIFETVESKSARYRVAGNSIVVDVFAAILKGVYIDHSFEDPKPKQTSIDRW